MVQPLEVASVGMVNGVGLYAEASCAAIRCAIDNFQETRFMEKGGEWIIGSEVPLERPWRGLAKLCRMAAMAIQDCLESAKRVHPSQIPLLLCVAEKDRPGRLAGLDDELFGLIEEQLGFRFDRRSRVIAGGRVGGVDAIEVARRLIYKDALPWCMVAGVDSFLVGPTLAAYEERDRLLTSKNSDGFIPGEGAAAVLLTRSSTRSDSPLTCQGTGFAVETATVASEEPLRADGLVAAIQGALSNSGCSMGDTDYRITDLSGEQYGFKESTFAVSRTLRDLKPEYDILHPADCVGEVGAAIVPTVLAVTYYSNRKAYAPGGTALAHFGADDGRRAALILRGQVKKAA